jgi:homoserine O-acetyltransferase
VESYLHYQGKSFVKRFDANSYLYITKAMDYFDLTKNGSLAEGFEDVKAKFLVISVDSDWLYPPAQSKEIVMALTANNIDVSYCELKSPYGHDAFLLEEGQLNYIISGFLSDILVGDVMAAEVTKISEESSIDEAAKMMLENKVTHLPVVADGDKLIGIVTAWDISKAVALKCSKLEEIMTKKVIVSNPEDRIEKAAEKMNKYNISSLPVVDDNRRVIGIITTDHISTLITRD